MKQKVIIIVLIVSLGINLGAIVTLVHHWHHKIKEMKLCIEKEGS